jgi:hypothetical protein
MVELSAVLLVSAAVLWGGRLANAPEVPSTLPEFGATDVVWDANDPDLVLVRTGIGPRPQTVQFEPAGAPHDPTLEALEGPFILRRGSEGAIVADGLRRIATGGDGSVWMFSVVSPHQVGFFEYRYTGGYNLVTRRDASGELKVFVLGPKIGADHRQEYRGRQLPSLVAPNGDLWFVLRDASRFGDWRVARLTLDGQLSVVSTPVEIAALSFDSSGQLVMTSPTGTQFALLLDPTDLANPMYVREQRPSNP